MESVASIFIGIAILMTIVGFLAALGGSIVKMTHNIEKSKVALMGAAGVVVLFVICYVLASGDVPAQYSAENVISTSTYKASGAGIMMLILMTLGGFAAIVADVVKSVLKK